MARKSAPKTPSFADPKGEFPLDLTTWFFHLFLVIARHRDAALDKALKALGLNVSKHRALAAIALSEPCTMSMLAEVSAVDRTTMTRTVDQLVGAGWVERATPAGDRRQVLLTLTAAGRTQYRRALKVILAANGRALAGISEIAQRRGARVLEAVLGNILADGAMTDRLLFRSVDPGPQSISLRAR